MRTYCVECTEEVINSLSVEDFEIIVNVIVKLRRTPPKELMNAIIRYGELYDGPPLDIVDQKFGLKTFFYKNFYFNWALDEKNPLFSILNTNKKTIFRNYVSKRWSE